METAKVKVWDLPTRTFHWLLVIAFFIAYLTEDELLLLHVWAGYAVLALLAFRLVWGFAGNQYARFANFLCSPAKSLAYLQDVVKLNSKRYLGHNPAGNAMIVMLTVTLLLTCISGIIVYAADQNLSPLAGRVDSTHEKVWEEVYELIANFTLFLVFIHVFGVLFESAVHNENLVKAMWDGYKKADGLESFDN